MAQPAFHTASVGMIAVDVCHRASTVEHYVF